jgi:uroporphyrinogen III methyltransferase/synthase
VQAACIGPVTAKAAREAGFRIVAVADPHTTDGLVRALVDWRARSR